MNRAYLNCLLIFLATFSLNGQNPPLLQHFTAGDFGACLEAAEQLLQADPTDAQAHFFKGAALVRLQRYQEALPALALATKHQYANPVYVQSNQLRAHAGLQQTQQVLEELSNLADQGFIGLQVLESEEFTYLQAEPAFVQLKDQVQKNANPCLYGAAYQPLDFWIGNWDVYVGGKKTADSKITKSVDGCSLHEDYQTLSGFTGSSMSFYDGADSLYKQIWIDKFNSIMRFTTVQSDPGYLQMQATAANGALSRMTYQHNREEDTVTQTMEASTDQGKTWTQNFVGVYKRKKGS